MLNICGDTICKPLELIFKQALTTGVFSSKWKKGNIVPCYKKGNKQNLKNYRPVSLLPMCGKIFERLIFNEIMFLGDSCINQLLLMKFIHLLMIDLKLEAFAWIYLKHSIKFGMKGLYLNLSKTVFRMTC